MRRVARGLLVILLSLFVCHSVLAADYRVVIIPDNIANKPSIDSFIYEEAAEFFSSQIINTLNISGTIESPTISEIKEQLQRSPRLLNETKTSMLRFKKVYNVDFINAQKLAKMFNTNKILLITTSADSQNYFMRRTLWDFLNVAGATVIDPAIKLSTYAVLIDTDKNVELWSSTFYKPISSCENRMVANTLSPSTEQLEKIKDYSKMLAPQIAQSVQANVIPASLLTKANTITYGPKNFDNIVTKKFRWYKTGAKIIYTDSKDKYGEHLQRQRDIGIEPLVDKIHRLHVEHKKNVQTKHLQKAKAKYEKAQKKLDNTTENNIQKINNKKSPTIEKDVNVIEINTSSPNKEIKKQEEPKIINISKDEKSEVIDSENAPKLKYYPIKTKIRTEQKNTTINDI